jgi:hypothetical protein
MRRPAPPAAAALVALAAAMSAAPPAGARPFVPAEQRNPAWTAQIPTCDDPAVIGHIQRRFDQRESNYWQSGLSIAAVDRVRPIAWRPWGRDYIPRRYCEARAWMSDGRKRTVSYNIIEGGGIIGATWGVEWCVSGLDRLFYYAPNCRMARP